MELSRSLSDRLQPWAVALLSQCDMEMVFGQTRGRPRCYVDQHVEGDPDGFPEFLAERAPALHAENSDGFLAKLPPDLREHVHRPGSSILADCAAEGPSQSCSHNLAPRNPMGRLQPSWLPALLSSWARARLGCVDGLLWPELPASRAM